MENKDTDMCCDSSEFKVGLYTGGESWGSCAGKEFLDWSVEIVLSLQSIGDFSKCISLTWFPLPAVWLKEGHLGTALLQQCLAAKLHDKLPRLLYCAKALHVHLGSQFWLGFPYLTLIPLTIWIKCMCNARQSVFIISVLYEVFANAGKRDSKMLLLSRKTWLGGSLFSRRVWFHTCDGCTVWSVEVRQLDLVPTWFLFESLGLGIEWPSSVSVAGSPCWWTWSCRIQEEVIRSWCIVSRDVYLEHLNIHASVWIWSI